MAKEQERKSEVVSVRMYPSFLAQIQIRSQNAGVTKAEIINEAIADYLQKQQWVPVTIRREILVRNIVERVANIHVSIKTSTKLSEIEVEMAKLSQILDQKDLFTSDNLLGSGLIGDIQEILMDIKEFDEVLFEKCVSILKTRKNKALVESRILVV